MDTGLELQYVNQFALTKTGPEYLLQFGQLFVHLPSGWTKEEFLADRTREVNVKARLILSRKGLMALREVVEKGMARMSQEEMNEANLGD